ncbi:hypothetical protein CROQUDRAFT_667291 [Cronartium quercuum f. sp. fusiforme G11]|uniref:Phosphatidate phosphatase APP1 catalytic domain-containing protein n=1 Tax=Cronartium quercuum f. sp. fusiforme G11 TaxID=708437 RepID=A0A9P6NYE4_9BASI|nr:hypothetical protein CROQUDRAFT_667291 [Cronartium quercuum f. sp. fusiforme G11]
MVDPSNPQLISNKPQSRPTLHHLRQSSSPNLEPSSSSQLPPPARPASQQLSHVSRLSLSYFQPQSPSSATNQNSRRSVLASKALNLSSKLLTKSANYLSSTKDPDKFTYPNPPGHSFARSPGTIHTWEEWDNDTSNWHMQVGGHRLPDTSSKTLPSNPQPVASSSASGYLSYFNRQNRDKRNRELYAEEHLVCFPGYAALRSPSHARAGDIEVFLHFHAFRAKKNLESLNRSQRLVYSMICKLTGLPPLTSTSTTTSTSATAVFPQSELTSAELDPVEDLISWSDEDLSDRPQLLPSSSTASISNPLPPTQPHKIIMTLPTPIKTHQATPFDSKPPSRSSRSSSDSVSSTLPVPTTADLTRLHTNLRERLRAFFSVKAEGRQIRVKVLGCCQPGPARLFGPTKVGGEDELLNHGRPLLTQVITTRPGGVWAERLVLPWQIIESQLRVHERERGMPVGGRGVVRLRVEAELLPENGLEPEREPSSFVMELDVIPSLAEAVHLISDIDDTIKQTNVLGGLKQMFRNVFLSEFSEVKVPGMSAWYQAMSELGCWIHYISNSPLELWGGIEGFLVADGFPRGSVSLKEYARGAGSILSGMLESSGARKRARVERIINEFPNSKFICVGDSGEQDLEMYTAVAIAHPQQVLAIYIRDVTTPPGLPSPETHTRSEPIPTSIRQSLIFPPRSPRLRASLPSVSRAPLPLIPPKPSHLSSSRSTLVESPAPTLTQAALEQAIRSPRSSFEADEGVVELLRTRVRKAEVELARLHIRLKLFRSGEECMGEALALASQFLN